LPIAPVLMAYSPLGPGPGFLMSNTFLTVSSQVLSTRPVRWHLSTRKLDIYVNNHCNEPATAFVSWSVGELSLGGGYRTGIGLLEGGEVISDCSSEEVHYSKNIVVPNLGEKEGIEESTCGARGHGTNGGCHVCTGTGTAAERSCKPKHQRKHCSGTCSRRGKHL
jgi:hypothetical protein